MRCFSFIWCIFVPAVKVSVYFVLVLQRAQSGHRALALQGRHFMHRASRSLTCAAGMEGCYRKGGSDGAGEKAVSHCLFATDTSTAHLLAELLHVFPAACTWKSVAVVASRGSGVEAALPWPLQFNCSNCTVSMPANVIGCLLACSCTSRFYNQTVYALSFQNSA